MTEPPRRVRVVGNAGAGKSTVARRLARRLGVPHLELDALYHEAGWRPAAPADFHARLQAFVQGPGAAGWVVDGNYRTVLDGALDDDADVVLWLDYPRRVVMGRVVRRTLGRLMTRRVLWNGNRERWSSLVRRDPEQNIVLWSWTRHGRARARHGALAARDPRWVRLVSPRATRRWLDALPAPDRDRSGPGRA